MFTADMLVSMVKAVVNICVYLCARDIHVKNFHMNNHPLKQAKGLTLLPYI